MSNCSSNHSGNISASFRTNAHTKDGFSSPCSCESSDWRNISPQIVPQRHRQTPSTATQTCGGKGRKVTVKMTSFGLLGHGCPPSCCCWDIGPLSSTAPPSPFLSCPVLSCLCSTIISQDVCQECLSDYVYMQPNTRSYRHVNVVADAS